VHDERGGPSLLKAIVDLYIKHQCIVNIEKTTFQTLISPLLRVEAAKRGIYIPIEERKVDTTKAKEQRIQVLQGPVSGRRFFVREEMTELVRDLVRFPLERYKDLLDAISAAAIYQRIEKLRLGDRLKVRWDVADLPMRALIPSLTIQPLLENAIYHGIELLPDGGEVTVTGKRDGRDLVISMSNPVASGTERSKRGNKMAMGNIRQRFELAYGNRAAVEISDESDRFTVSLRFPLEEGEA